MATETDETSTVSSRVPRQSVSTPQAHLDRVACSSTRVSTRFARLPSSSPRRRLRPGIPLMRFSFTGVQDLEEELSVLVRLGRHSRPRLAFAHLPVASRQGNVTLFLSSARGQPALAFSLTWKIARATQPGRQGLYGAPHDPRNPYLGRGQQLSPDRDRALAETRIRVEPRQVRRRTGRYVTLSLAVLCICAQTSSPVFQRLAVTRRQSLECASRNRSTTRER